MTDLLLTIVYVVGGLIILLGVAPFVLYLWGAMLTRGIMSAYFEVKNKYKYNGKKEE